MPRIITVLEAHVSTDRKADLQAAYRDAARDAFPPGLLRSALLQSTSDPTVWRIETLWESREALDAMRGTGTPRGILMFRAAGAEPVPAVFELQDELSPRA
jgi:quinol monooxygenase YgiN